MGQTGRLMLMWTYRLSYLRDITGDKMHTYIQTVSHRLEFEFGLILRLKLSLLLLCQMLAMAS